MFLFSSQGKIASPHQAGTVKCVLVCLCVYIYICTVCVYMHRCLLVWDEVVEAQKYKGETCIPLTTFFMNSVTCLMNTVAPCQLSQ